MTILASKHTMNREERNLDIEIGRYIVTDIINYLCLFWQTLRMSYFCFINKMDEFLRG